jgi:hypothetical protein
LPLSQPLGELLKAATGATQSDIAYASPGV